MSSGMWIAIGVAVGVAIGSIWESIGVTAGIALGAGMGGVMYAYTSENKSRGREKEPHGNEATALDPTRAIETPNEQMSEPGKRVPVAL